MRHTLCYIKMTNLTSYFHPPGFLVPSNVTPFVQGVFESEEEDDHRDVVPALEHQCFFGQCFWNASPWDIGLEAVVHKVHRLLAVHHIPQSIRSDDHKFILFHQGKFYKEERRRAFMCERERDRSKINNKTITKQRESVQEREREREMPKEML
jgi:hypothetical protein